MGVGGGVRKEHLGSSRATYRGTRLRFIYTRPREAKVRSLTSPQGHISEALPTT